MSYPQFLEQLIETGRVTIHTVEHPSKSEIDSGTEVLRQFENAWRAELAGVAPKFHQPTASWAGCSMYRACQCLLFRDLPSETVVESLALPCPEADTKPQQHYNVDLTFRFLPNFWRFTQSEAEDDPLTEIVRTWCFQWPLSSVGAANLTGTNSIISEADERKELADQFQIDSFWSHSGLAQTYIDRIIDQKDKTRLAYPVVAERIRAVAGVHTKLIQSFESELLTKEERTNGT